jgi:hypothetical protein
MLVAGCSTNVMSKSVGGAAAGAASAGLLGAVTDLIVDGRVNTYRLERNLVSGAIAGGVAGAAVGHQQDVAQARRVETETAVRAGTAPQPVVMAETVKAQTVAEARRPDRELVDQIGKDNYQALTELLYYRHEDAYRQTLNSVKSSNQEHREAGYVIQAMIDDDRGNPAGVEQAVARFLEINETVGGAKEVQEGLEALGEALDEERKVKGIAKPTS